jgi:hypothetical protein
MKFLVTDFEINESTEAAYLSHELNQYEEHESILISPRDTIYDYGDKFKPDIIISSLNALSKGVIDYLQDNPHIKFILHTGNALLKNVMDVENMLEERNINCVFMFNSTKPVLTRKIPFVRISNGADIGLIKSQPHSLFKFTKALFLSKIATYEDINKFSSNNDNFHIISSIHTKEVVDIFRPERSIIPLYRSYEEIIFVGLEEVIPQPFFDAICSGAKTYFIPSGDETKLALSKLFDIDNLDLDYNSENKLQDFTKLREILTNKHTSINRAKSILSQIPKT